MTANPRREPSPGTAGCPSGEAGGLVVLTAASGMSKVTVAWDSVSAISTSLHDPLCRSYWTCAVRRGRRHLAPGLDAAVGPGHARETKDGKCLNAEWDALLTRVVVAAALSRRQPMTGRIVTRTRLSVLRGLVFRYSRCWPARRWRRRGCARGDPGRGQPRCLAPLRQWSTLDLTTWRKS